MEIKEGIHIVKKFLSVLSAAAIMITASASAAFSAGALTIDENRMDVNQDGSIDMMDLVSFSKYFAGFYGVVDSRCYDIDHDGITGSADLKILRMHVSGQDVVSWEIV